MMAILREYIGIWTYCSILVKYMSDDFSLKFPGSGMRVQAEDFSSDMSGLNSSLREEILDYWSVRAATFDAQPGQEIFDAAERHA